MCFSMFQLIENKFIHSNLISRSLIGSLVNTRSVLKMSTALRVLRPDCARCFWCVIARVIVISTDPFFHWVKLLIFFMISGILKPFYLYFFHEHEQISFCFSVVYELGQYMRKSCSSRHDSNPVHLRRCWCSSNALTFGSCIGRAPTSARVHWIWIISLVTRLTHLLTYNSYTPTWFLVHWLAH